MTKEEKIKEIESIKERIDSYDTVYLADISGLDSKETIRLRRVCFKADIKLKVVKNTLLKKAMEFSDKDFEEFYGSLEGSTSLMLCEQANTPAKVIKEFRKKNTKPLLKGAYINEAIYIGDDQLNSLASMKSKEEVIGDILTLLQLPAKNVLSALQSSKSKLAGIVKTLSER